MTKTPLRQALNPRNAPEGYRAVDDSGFHVVINRHGSIRSSSCGKCDLRGTYECRDAPCSYSMRPDGTVVYFLKLWSKFDYEYSILLYIETHGYSDWCQDLT